MNRHVAYHNSSLDIKKFANKYVSISVLLYLAIQIGSECIHLLRTTIHTNHVASLSIHKILFSTTFRSSLIFVLRILWSCLRLHNSCTYIRGTYTTTVPLSVGHAVVQSDTVVLKLTLNSKKQTW